MLYPTMPQLLEKVNSRYLLVNVVANRARQISAEAEEEGIHSVPEIARRLLERIGCGMPEKLFLACWTVASHLKER